MCKHEWDNVNITRCPNCDPTKRREKGIQDGSIKDSSR